MERAEAVVYLTRSVKAQRVAGRGEPIAAAAQLAFDDFSDDYTPGPLIRAARAAAGRAAPRKPGKETAGEEPSSRESATKQPAAEETASKTARKGAAKAEAPRSPQERPEEAEAPAAPMPKPAAAPTRAVLAPASLEDPDWDIESCFAPDKSGKEWLLSVVGSALEAEVRTQEQVPRRNPKVLERVRELSVKVQKKLAALPDTELGLPSFEQRANPKNAELLARAAVLEVAIQELETETADLNRLEQERTAALEQQAAAAAAAATAAATAAAAATSAAAGAGVVAAAPAPEELIAPDADAGPASLKRRLDKAIAEVAFTNAKLREVQRMSQQGEGVSRKLAKIVESRAFASYHDMHEPQRLIRALAAGN
jgi:hypothetical protein